MHLILLIVAGLFLGTLAIFLAIILSPVIVGFLVFVGAIILAIVIAVLEWISDKFEARSRKKAKAKGLKALRELQKERGEQ